jgi:hypothetical protein
MGGSAENQALVVTQRLQPPGNIGGVIFPHFRDNAQIGSEESQAELCHRLLGTFSVISSLSAMPDIGASVGEKAVGLIEALDRREGGNDLVGDAAVVPDLVHILS